MSSGKAARSDAGIELTGVEVEASKSWERVLTVTLSAEQWQRARAEALGVVRRHAQLPGFRKGKVPKDLVLKHYGPQVEMEGLEWLLPRAWRQALVDAKVMPINDPEYSDIDFGEESGELTFKGTVEVRPEVKIGGYKGLNVTWYKESEPADAVQRTLESLAEGRARYKDVERPAAAGDTVLVDFRQIEPSGEVILGTEVKGHSIELGSPAVLKEFSDGVIGMSKGDQKRFPVTYPADFEQEALAGQTRHFLVTLGEVAEKVLPVLDDEFAATIGEFATIDALREMIARNIKADIEQRNGQRLEAALVQGLLSVNECEVPPSMVDHSVEQLIKDQEERQGAPLREEERTRAREGLRTGSEIAIKRWFMQDAVAEQESLAVSDEEFETHLQKIAAAEGVELDQVKQSVQKAHAERRIREDLLHRKVFDFLKSEAKIKEDAVPASTGS